MNTDHPMPNPSKEPHPNSPPLPIPGNCYVEPAPLTEVMFDQLEYLVGHGARRAPGDCSPGCVDCGRLQQVKNWLLLPFHSSPYPI